MLMNYTAVNPHAGAPPPPPLRLQAYTSLMGLVVMDEDLKIRNYNHNFISLTFGYEKGSLIDKVRLTKLSFSDL